jgi:hypothetical protein
VSRTKAYDALAFRYLSYFLYPALVAYTAYSLMYEEHKSWYSFVLGTLVGFVYAFGFITMTVGAGCMSGYLGFCALVSAPMLTHPPPHHHHTTTTPSQQPQLFINYKLKSVAHMPWRTFMYKALNTFIDDLFAFVIKMPWLHRLACLRDDVIFVVYLYQRWIYPEDKRRRNEFGQVGEGESDEGEGEEEEEEAKGKKVKGEVAGKEAKGKDADAPLLPGGKVGVVAAAAITPSAATPTKRKLPAQRA